MPEYLSDAWVAEATALAAGLAEHAGADAVVQVLVTGASGPEAKHAVTVVSGRPVTWSAGVAPDPDVTVTLSAADWVAIGAGTLDPGVAFMRGALKAEGDQARFLAVLAAAHTDDHRAYRARLVAFASS